MDLEGETSRPSYDLVTAISSADRARKKKNRSRFQKISQLHAFPLRFLRTAERKRGLLEKQTETRTVGLRGRAFDACALHEGNSSVGFPASARRLSCERTRKSLGARSQVDTRHRRSDGNVKLCEMKFAPVNTFC